MAGAISRTATAPVDRLKMIMQVGVCPPPPLSAGFGTQEIQRCCRSCCSRALACLPAHQAQIRLGDGHLAASDAVAYRHLYVLSVSALSFGMSCNPSSVCTEAAHHSSFSMQNMKQDWISVPHESRHEPECQLGGRARTGQRPGGRTTHPSEGLPDHGRRRCTTVLSAIATYTGAKSLSIALQCFHRGFFTQPEMLQSL